MNRIRCIGVALAIAVLASACVGKEKAPPADTKAMAGADNWEPGKDLAGTQVVIDGVSQKIPDDAAASKRKLDAVAADYKAQMDEAERKRQTKVSADADLQP